MVEELERGRGLFLDTVAVHPTIQEKVGRPTAETQPRTDVWLKRRREKKRGL